MDTNNYKAQIVIFILLTMIFMSSVSWAATYYVATTGSDTNQGTSAAPWKTIQKAANTMEAGDTVTVQPGTYNEQVTMRKSGEAGALITFKASGVAKVMQGFISNANYIVIDGFDITNSLGQTSTANGIYIHGAYNIAQNNYIHDLRYQGIRVGDQDDNAAYHDNIVRGNTIYKAGQSGIAVGGRNSLIEHNEISHTLAHPPGGDVPLQPDADGIYYFGTGHTIRQNYLHNITCADPGNTSPHIDCFQTWGPAYNIVIEQNLCDNPETYTSDGCQPHGMMVTEQTPPVRDLQIKNNIFQTQVGVLIHDAEGTAVVNNTFKGRIVTDGTWAAGVQLVTSPHITVENNLFYNVGNNRYPYFGADAASLVGSVVGYNCHYMSNGKSPAGSPHPNDLWQQNPQLVDVSGGNLHLQSSSPLVNTGITLSAVLTDFDAVVRPQGGAYDIGAYEYTPPSAALPAAPSQLTTVSQ